MDNSITTLRNNKDCFPSRCMLPYGTTALVKLRTNIKCCVRQLSWLQHGLALAVTKFEYLVGGVVSVRDIEVFQFFSGISSFPNFISLTHIASYIPFYIISCSFISFHFYVMQDDEVVKICILYKWKPTISRAFGRPKMRREYEKDIMSIKLEAEYPQFPRAQN